MSVLKCLGSNWHRTNILISSLHIHTSKRFFHPTPPRFHGNHSHSQTPPKAGPIKGIKNIIAVSSAKGGVGKSTTAVNLALALSGKGHRVGLLDADVYGPSIPIMMNLRGSKPAIDDNNKMIPLVNYGIKCMSMGFLVEEDSALIWRGPMVMSAVDQMVYKVQWGELDALVVDLPPGTGDAVLSLAQRVPLTGAVVVSTPQDVALLDVVRGVNMFRKVNVPILGVVENMSFYQCTQCGHKEHIFGQDGAKQTAEKMNVFYLGHIPIDIQIRKTADSGHPVVISAASSSSAQAYSLIADQVITRLQEVVDESAPPNIVIQ